MSYANVNGLGAWTAFGAVDPAAAKNFQSKVNNTAAQVRSNLDKFLAELKGSVVAQVFVQSAIDSSETLAQSIQNGLTKTIPSLMQKMIAGDQTAPDRIMDLLEKYQRTLEEVRADFASFWAQTPAATRLLVTMLAGLSELAGLVFEASKYLFNKIPTSGKIGIGLIIALGIGGFIALKVLLK